ncbi:hypothetical protein Tco_1292304 [Tanacetum coccineum]
MDTPPPPNHMFDFPTNDPSSSDDSDEKFEEDPQEALEEDHEEDHEEALEEEEEEPEEEPKEAQAIREATRVENIRLRRKLEDVEIRYTLMRMGKERAERDLREMPN